MICVKDLLAVLMFVIIVVMPHILRHRVSVDTIAIDKG